MSDDAPELVERLQRANQGDEQTLTDILSEFRGRLKRMVSLRMDHRLQGRVDPSDVLQEAFLEVSDRLPTYMGDRSMPFFIWVRFITAQRLNILHRRHLGTQRRDAKREISINRSSAPEVNSGVLAAHLIGRHSTPSKAIQRAERKLRLEEALESMEPIDREILVLRHFEELTNSECALVLDISSTAANNRYIRALRRLREVLASMPGGVEEMLP